MIIAMAGLPGTGKSSIARRLATILSGVILDKDELRTIVFRPSEIDYSRAQDEICIDILYQLTEHILSHDPNKHVIIDGRTYSKQHDIDKLVRLARRLGTRLKIIECHCADVIAKQRLKADITKGRHYARNRTPELYFKLKAQAEPIKEPKLNIDTGINSFEECVKLAMDYVTMDDKL